MNQNNIDKFLSERKNHMGIINKFIKRFVKKENCIFCKSEEGPFEYVQGYSVYDHKFSGYQYHEHCLIDVATNPEKYSDNLVEKALEIASESEYKKRRALIRKENFGPFLKNKAGLP